MVQPVPYNNGPDVVYAPEVVPDGAVIVGDDYVFYNSYGVVVNRYHRPDYYVHPNLYPHNGYRPNNYNPVRPPVVYNPSHEEHVPVNRPPVYNPPRDEHGSVVIRPSVNPTHPVQRPVQHPVQHPAYQER